MGGGVSSVKKRETLKKSSLHESTAMPFVNGGPSIHYDEVHGCFALANSKGELKSQPGMFFRIVNYKMNQWLFYNDTREFNMVVTGYFGSKSQILAVGQTRLYLEEPSQLLIAELVVPPLSTESYVECKTIDGYDLHFKAIAIR